MVCIYGERLEHGILPLPIQPLSESGLAGGNSLRGRLLKHILVEDSFDVIDLLVYIVVDVHISLLELRDWGVGQLQLV